MSRIRSVHPGLFTDEAYMSASPLARLLIIGIWCESWDDGVFEWKPLTLKVRLFPADAVDVAPLLAELEGLNMIRRFDAGGKMYGAVRNFQRYQKPKKPNSSRVLPDEFGSYVGARTTKPEPVPNQFRTNGGPVPLGEEDGEGEEIPDASASNEATASAAALVETDPEAEVWADPEQWFWDRAGELAAKGCARAQFGALVRLHNGDWQSLIPAMRRVQAAREPSSFLHKLVGNLRRDAEAHDPPKGEPSRRRRNSEPDFVRSARAEGLHVVSGTRRNGRPKWQIGTEIYDEHGIVIGF